LGIPLIEIATSAEISSPENCKEVAEHLGMILRSTKKVKRGLGTIRQDVNISIKGGARVEVKGFQDLRSIPKVIEYEVERQSSLLSTGKKVLEEVRKAESNLTTSFLRPMPGASRMYPETDIKPIEITKEILSNIPKVKLIKDLAKRLQKKYNLTEIHSNQLIKLGIDFESFIKRYPDIKANFIAQTLIELPKELKRRYKLEVGLDLFEEPFSELNRRNITNEAFFEIVLDLAKGKKPNYDKYKPLSEKEILKDIKHIISKNKKASINALMGQVMSKYRGRIDGKKVMELLKKHI
jgi:Glu-tRNA(Gln) amidotransferase subunit E-like FAD-binding protein